MQFCSRVSSMLLMAILLLGGGLWPAPFEVQARSVPAVHDAPLPPAVSYTRVQRAPTMVTLRHAPTTFDFHVPAPAAYRQRQPQTAVIVIDYLPVGTTDVGGSLCKAWPAAAQAAFRYAADIWQTLMALQEFARCNHIIPTHNPVTT